MGIFILGGMLISSPRAHADDDGSKDLAAIGLKIAPVTLNMQGKDRHLVGLGSFIVNAQADCNGCHGSDPTMQYKDPGNPFFNQHPMAQWVGESSVTYLAPVRTSSPAT